MKLALKIDVDTYRGLEGGAPQLASFLSSQKIPASFFVTLGPDTSGRAIKRLWTRRGFAKKMQRTSALAMYGWRTVLSGTLLPARPMGASFGDSLRRWKDQGFEVSPHGYDHIRWHDDASGWSEAEAHQELERTFEVYRQIFKQDPTSFAAPGWQAGAGSWAALEGYKLLYHSDTRGDAPYLPRINGRDLSTLEIPTTLPTWDEMLAWDHVTTENVVARTQTLLRDNALNVWTIHAEVEGGLYFPQFKEFIMKMKEHSATWVFLPDAARECLKSPSALPRHSISPGERPGRAGPVTCQHG